MMTPQEVIDEFDIKDDVDDFKRIFSMPGHTTMYSVVEELARINAKINMIISILKSPHTKQ